MLAHSPLLLLLLVFLALVQAVFIEPHKASKPVFSASSFGKTVFYGGQRSTLDADEVIQRGMNIGMVFHLMQFTFPSHSFQKPLAIMPSAWPADSPAMPVDAKDFIEACNYTVVNYVLLNNKECDSTGTNCAFLPGMIWGTLKGMNWTKDGLLFLSCNILKVKNASKCSANLNGDCKAHVHQDFTPYLYRSRIDAGEIVSAGNATTIQGLTHATIEYARQSKQDITLPGGRKMPPRQAL